MSEARRRKKRTSARPAPAKKRRPAVRYFDYSMLAVLVFLVCFGLIMLYSSSSYSALVKYNDSMYFLTSNLSSAIIVAGNTVCLLFVVHPKTKPFMVLAGSGLTAAIIAVAVLNRMIQDAGSSGSFRLRRVLVWLQPEQYASGSGYQTLQGLYAIGSGGFFGKGLGNSAQKMIIPEVQNDMILSVICEELGVCGVIIVLVLFGLLLYRLMFIAQNAPDMYGALIASGIFAHIAIQVILNIAVVTNTIPNTGVTLPFISYGGTSILFLMAEMGIALSISRQIRVEE